MASVDDDLATVGVVLVEDRVLRRIIKRHRRLPGLGLQVAHADGYALPRADLEKLVEADELGIERAKLPDTVVVFAGSRDDLAKHDPDALCRVWRIAFHGKVHQAFDELLAAKTLTDAAIRERVHRIGQVEFDEIRLVLRQEERLLPPVDTTSTYVEFVALFLELTHFAPGAIPRTFPSLGEPSRVAAIVGLELDGAALLAAARPPHAPDKPIVDTVELGPRLDEAPRAFEPVPGARKGAARARAKGNRARAATLAIRSGDLGAGRADIEELCARLARALGCDEVKSWSHALMPVAQYAASQRVLRFTAGSRLLHDLQTVCVVAEREIKVVDVMTWALSLGKRPVVRSLPATREVRIAKHLHAASGKIAECGLSSSAERERLAQALHDMVGLAEKNVRAVLRPKIEAALDDVELRPHHLPERVAQKKLVDEPLLDQAVAVGRLSLGNLRDAISKNDLKMSNLTVRQLVKGDQLLRCDKVLSVSLDGVYRRGESYLRFLQKLSSVLFGTVVGRFLSLYALLPAIGSFMLLQGAQHIVEPICKHLLDVEAPEIATNTAYIVFGAFLFFLINFGFFRRGVLMSMRMLWRGIRALLIDLPRLLLRFSIVRRFLVGPIWRWVIKPGIPAAITFFAVPAAAEWPAAIAVFVVAGAFANLRYGRLVEEYVTDWSMRSGRYVARRIAPGIWHLIIEVFSKLIELLDRAIYRVDEWLRFKAGQSTITLVIKGVLATLWFFVTYFLRIYINLMIEPMVNPIKHFPTVTVAGKLMVPFYQPVAHGIRNTIEPVVGRAFATSFGTFTSVMIPGFAGFLLWELKENWRLYAATRPEDLRPVAIGHHGETMVGLMKLGFHSGTIPKAFAKLRRSTHKRDERGVAKHKEHLHHVEEAIARFAERSLVATLVETESFRANDVAVEHVELGSNRVDIVLSCASLSPSHATIELDQQSGWLVASVPKRGWIDALDDDRQAIFELALSGFYKLAAVDFVREQLDDVLRGEANAPPPYDISDEGLVVWPGTGYFTEVVYDLRSRLLLSSIRGAAFSGPLVVLFGRHAVFAREPIAWGQWATAWIDLGRGEPAKRIIAGPPLLKPRAEATATPLAS